MNRKFYLPLIILGLISLILTGCPKSVDERIRESTHIGALDEATHARDLALDAAVQENIQTDPVLLWYAKTYGITVEVSHTVATVHMIVKTEELKEQALQLARQTQGITEVVDEIVVDPNVDEAPFEW
jgi:osmotically-inducible protein OsmY